MKSYTDLDQSCILADILLLDSADCFYRRFVDNYNAIQYTLEMYPYNKGADKIHDLPCWSLSALLDALPRIEHEDLVMAETPSLRLSQPNSIRL
jgi:hypothetical protein